MAEDETNEQSSRGLFYSTSIAQNNNAGKNGREKVNKSSQFSESRCRKELQCEQLQLLAMSRSYSERENHCSLVEKELGVNKPVWCGLSD